VPGQERDRQRRRAFRQGQLGAVDAAVDHRVRRPAARAMGERHAGIVLVGIENLRRDRGRDQRAIGRMEHARGDVVAVEVDRPRVTGRQEHARLIALEQRPLGQGRQRPVGRMRGIPFGEARMLGEVARLVGAGGEREQAGQDRCGAVPHQPRPR